MPTLMAEAKEQLAEPMEKLKTDVQHVVETAGKKARFVMRRGAEKAEELKHDAEREVRKHPLETVALVFAAGFLIGGFASWLTRRK